MCIRDRTAAAAVAAAPQRAARGAPPPPPAPAPVAARGGLGDSGAPFARGPGGAPPPPPHAAAPRGALELSPNGALSHSFDGGGFDGGGFEGGGFDGGGFERKASASLLVSPLSRSPSRNAFGVRPAHLRNHVNSLPLTVAHSWGMQILERPGTTGSIGRTVRSYDSHR